jgi:tetratricopeptide (TPR) repeat protein
MILDLYSGRYQEALLKAEVADSSDFPDQGRRFLLLADIHKNLNNDVLARSHYKSAFEYYNRRLVENPDDPGILGLIGISAAGLKERAKALDAGVKALTLTKYNGMDKSDRMMDLANIYMVLGEYDKAMDLIEELLKNPSSLSPGLLKLDPVWKPLSERPRFKALLEKYTTNG